MLQCSNGRGEHRKLRRQEGCHVFIKCLLFTLRHQGSHFPLRYLSDNGCPSTHLHTWSRINEFVSAYDYN